MKTNDAVVPVGGGDARRHGPLAWRASMALSVLLLASCSGTEQPENAATSASGVSQAAMQSADSTTPPLTSETDGATTSVGSQPANNGDATPPDAATATEVVEGGAEADSPASATFDQTTENPEDLVAPPGFTRPGEALQEDSFDGPDLEVAGVEVVDADSVQMTLNLKGQGFPGWQVEYAPKDRIPPEMPASTLEVVLDGVDLGDFDAAGIPLSERVDIKIVNSADDPLTLLLGVDGDPVPFRVHLQYEPLRLVVELAETGE